MINGIATMKKIALIITVVISVLVLVLGGYHLYNIAHHTVADSTQNWWMVTAELSVGIVGLSSVALVLGIDSHSPESTPETETADQIIARLKKRVQQDIVNNITGGLL